MERQIVRYETALGELAEHAGLQAFAGPAGFYAWQRLEALVGRLRAVYDLYELEGDVAPVRREVEAYLADLRDHQLKPDPWVTSYLERFLRDLEPKLSVWTIETRVAAGRPTAWPDGLLAISPEELQALHDVLQERSRPRT